MKKLLLVLALAMALAIPAFAQQPIQQSTTAYKITFLMVDSSDHITGKTGLTPTVTLSKAGGSFASPSGAVSELSGGWYVIAGNATDTGTLGELLLHATGTGADPTDMRVGVVVAYNPQDSVRLGLTAMPNAAAGASGGLLINGSNSGTVTLAALTVTGSFTISDGLLVSRSSSNASAITATGNGTGSGAIFTSGSGATGDGFAAIAASTNGNGFKNTGTGTGAGALLTSGGGATGDALKLVAASTNGNGINSTGVGTGSGLLATSGSGATGNGITATSAATAGQGLSATGNGTGHGILATSGSGATGDGFKAISAATNGNGLNGVGTGTGADIKGSGLEQLVSKAVASSFSGTVAANSVIGYLADISATSSYDRTTMSFEAAYSNAPTVANMATAIWQDTTSGDFTTASSIGKSLYTSGAVPGAAGGLFIAGTNAATTITTALTTTFTGNLSGSVGSVASGGITRASYAADTGHQSIRSNTAQAGAGTTITLDASASATNSFYNNDIVYITGGTGVGQARFISGYVGSTKVATVATWATNPDNTSTFAILPFDAVAGASAPTVAQIATGVWQDLTSGSDFTTSSSIGKRLVDDITGDIYARLGAPAGASVSADIAAAKVDTAAIKVKTDFLPSATAGAAGGVFIAGTNAATTITTGLTTHFIGTVDAVTTVNGLAANVITAASINDGAIDRATYAADTGLQTIRSNTAQAGASTSITLDASASASNSYYLNDKVYITGGTGVGQARTISAYNGSTKVATVTAWVTNPDNTSTFAILPDDAVSGASAPTASQVATAVWQDLMAGGDFGTSSSIGKLFADNITGNAYTRLGAPAGASIAADVAAVKAVLPSALVSGRIDASVGAIASNAITAASIASDADTEIENAVLNATTAGHATAGSIGKAIADAGSAGDPWGTALPGAYSSGTAGYIIGTNIQPVKTIAKGEAFTNVPIWMLSSTGAAVTGLTTGQISCQISIDGGAWTALTDTTETEIGLGKYVVDLSSGETNGNSISLDCSATGAQHYRTNLTPQR